MRRRLAPSILLAFACLLALSAAAPAGALTKSAQLRQDLRLLQVYIERSAAAKSFTYPLETQVKRGGGLIAPVWPKNPWTGRPMAPGPRNGDFEYTTDGASYTLVGHVPGGRYRLAGTAPGWLQTERDTALTQLATVQGQLTTAQTQLSTVQGQLATAQSDAAAARQQRDAAVADAVAAREARDTALAQLAAVQDRLTTAQDQLTTAQSQLATTQSQLTAKQSELDAANTALTAAQAALAPAQRQAAELGARLIKSYVEQWGMLNNATAPPADKVSKTGAVGVLFPYWPDNPFNGSPMTTGYQDGDFTYVPGAGGAYTMGVDTGAVTPVALDGTVPQQLTNALEAARDEYVKTSMYYLQGVIDHWASDNNDTYPATSIVNAGGLNDYAFDYWPSNPWFAATPMASGSTRGTYTYLPGLYSYTLTGHLSDGTGFTVDSYWSERVMGVRDRLKNMVLQAQGQVLKDYVEEWRAAHAGLPPTVDQMAKTEAVGAAHSWWPANPWVNAPMQNTDAKGDFQYTVGPGDSYTLTVRQAPVTPFAEYYMPE